MKTLFLASGFLLLTILAGADMLTFSKIDPGTECGRVVYQNGEVFQYLYCNSELKVECK